MLKVIYGKSGSGKSLSLYNDIKENLSYEKIFLIVPEQSNLSAEQNLFKALNVDSLLNVEVLTLSRMASRILNEFGMGRDIHLSKSGKAMIISDILKKENKNLKFLGKSDKNIDISINMITEFKKHDISTKALDEVQGLDTYTKLKLDDINLIYKKYNEKIENCFVDENDVLSIVADKISESTLFENSLVYIDDFIGFTAQEYKIFEELIKKCDRVTIAISTDSLEKVDKERDIFYFNKAFVNKLIDISKKNNSKVELLNCNTNYRLQNKELFFLEEYLSNFNYCNEYEEKPENIKIFLANNSYSELENVATTILDLIKNENYRYNEIAIISNNLDQYSSEAKIIFNKYDIPIFIDEKKDLNQNILIKYILAILDIFSKNWSFDSVFNYLKVGMLDIPYENIYLLENYCIKWGIKNYKWFKKFDYEDANETQEKLENLRNQIVEPLLKFKENVSKNRTVKEITKYIYEFLIKNDIPKILDNKIKSINDIEINNEYNTSYKILIKILDELVAIFGDEKITFEDYKELLQVGFSESELGKIPATQDVVILGDSKRSRNSNIKVCFIVGINDGCFPTNNKFEGYLNDDDREYLKSAGIELAKTSLELLYESNFEIYNVLTLASQKLYLSYASSDKEGKSIRPSILIKKIKRIFPKIEEESDIISKDFHITNKIATFDDAILVYKKFLNGEDIPDEWKNTLSYYHEKEKDKFERVLSGLKYTNKAEKISEKNIERMYGKKLKTSVSRLEQYRKCPFSFHLKYGLKIRENPEFRIQNTDTGTFLHEVINSFFETLDNENIDVKTIEEDKVKEIVEKIINDYLETSKYYIFSSTAKFRVLTKRLKKIILEVINYITYTIKNSTFDVFAHELEFSNSGKYKPIIMEIDDGKQVEIIGQIDRVDLAVENDKKYVRIIDYKSSVKDLDMNQVRAGLQIQLITYLDAISKQEDFEATGILYLGLIDSIYNAKKNMDDDDIKQEIKKMFRMKGLVVADVNIIRMMDNNLKTGTSDIVPVMIKNDGSISESKSSTINKSDFSQLQEEVNQVIKEISKEILNGKIDIKPFKYKTSTGCDYCQYKSICMFNPNIKENTYNYI